ncbi:hypothetical protein KOI35_25700 [Actinoplanes bogorensis]|uniref:DUF4190 domain-containing protein n=1 Tax=Paractinoplanes bogorensis TaxID=1610840 RepID=A0ABS5YTX3_9ACTN|nr:hypothetical protein [Actinoplanes bogorensis]MBU2666911.1 hypothetical protein [Actinoplanes bogorensis]
MTAEPRTTSQPWLSPSTPAAARHVHQAPLQGGGPGLAQRYQASERPSARPLFGAAPAPAYPSQGGQQTVTFAGPGVRTPSVWPVVLWTLFAFVAGSISAARRARKAERMGMPGTPYWTAFGITSAISIGLGLVLYLIQFAAFGLSTH